MSQCGEGSEQATSRCTETASKRRDECVETRDEGYSECTQTREERQKQCCDWWPCSMACKAFHWLVSVVCTAWEWVQNIVCVAWHTFVEVVCVAWIILPVIACHLGDAIASVVAALAAALEAALNWAWSIVAFAVDLVLAIPIVGRVFGWALELGKSVFNTVISLPDFVLTLLGVMPEKKLRLGVIVLKDSKGRPVVPDDALLLRAIQCAINIYREECNVRVIPIRYAQYQTSFASASAASPQYIFHDQEHSGDHLLDVCCAACGFGADLGSVGSDYLLAMDRATFWGGGRRLLGYGAPIVAFTVRSFVDGDVGCSLGPLTNHVTVVFQNSQVGTPDQDLTPAIPLGRVSSLAHEMAHACNVVWHASGSDNLLSRLPLGDRFCRLTRFQKALIRASRHVSYA